MMLLLSMEIKLLLRSALKHTFISVVLVLLVSCWPELGILHTYIREAGKMSIRQWVTSLQPCLDQSVMVGALGLGELQEHTHYMSEERDSCRVGT